MKADLYKRFFRAIYAEDIISLKKIAYSIFLIHPALRMKYPLVGTEQEWQALCYILLKSLAREIFGYLHGYET